MWHIVKEGIMYLLFRGCLIVDRERYLWAAFILTL